MVETTASKTQVQSEIPREDSRVNLMDAGNISNTRLNDGSKTDQAERRCTQEELDKADYFLDVAGAGLSSDDEHAVRHPSHDSDATEVLEGEFEGEWQCQRMQQQIARNNRSGTRHEEWREIGVHNCVPFQQR